MNRTELRCSCGQRVGQREVTQTGYYLQMFGPSRVCVRYRCSRCKKVGQKYVTQKEWENGILKEVTTDATMGEQQQFETLGPIQMRELVDFHQALENLPDLKAIQNEFARKPEKSVKSEMGRPETSREDQ